MKGIVYCIKELSTGDVIYVGSTTKLLCQRKGEHIAACYSDDIRRNNCDAYRYIRSKTSRETFNKFFIFETLYKCEVNSSEELRAIEDTYINMHKDMVLNMRVARQTEEQRKQQLKKANEKYESSHKEQRRAATKEWCDNNKDYISLHSKEYYKSNKEEILDKKHKDYEKNRDKVLAYKHEYYILHRDEILARRKAKRAAKKQCK